MDEPRSRRALGGDSLVTGTVVGEQAIFGFQPEQLDEEQGESADAGNPPTPRWPRQALWPRDAIPTYADGRWRHWTDDL
jgi:hypothetical protein